MKQRSEILTLGLILSLRHQKESIFTTVFNSHASLQLTSVFTAWSPYTDIKMDLSVKLLPVIYEVYGYINCVAF